MVVIFTITLLCTHTFLCFPGTEGRGFSLGKCGSTYRVTIPFFTNDSASANCISKVMENFMFPSPKYPNLKEVSDAGESSSPHLSSRCSFRPLILSNNGTSRRKYDCELFLFFSFRTRRQTFTVPVSLDDMLSIENSVQQQ